MSGRDRSLYCTHCFIQFQNFGKFSICIYFVRVKATKEIKCRTVEQHTQAAGTPIQVIRSFVIFEVDFSCLCMMTKEFNVFVPIEWSLLFVYSRCYIHLCMIFVSNMRQLDKRLALVFCLTTWKLNGKIGEINEIFVFVVLLICRKSAESAARKLVG